MNSVLIFALGSAALAILYGAVAATRLLKKDAGSARMQEISAAIAQGAKAYLNRQYKTIAVIGILVALVLYFALGSTMALGFVVGAVLSALAGYIGMNVSVRANSRVAHAAGTGLKPALALAFQCGRVVVTELAHRSPADGRALKTPSRYGI
jgi:K(+)-stimulated pyrophosphate-energized sodium pump